MDKSIKENLEHSIILMGPCGVGKSLIADNLSKRTGIPLLDIEELITCIYRDIQGHLSPDINTKRNFYKKQLAYLKNIQNVSKLTKEELQCLKKIASDDINKYNYYYKLLNGFKQFHKDYLHYCIAETKKHKGVDQIHHLNQLTLNIIKKIYKQTDTPFVISAPATLGWQSDNPLDVNIKFLQTKVNNLLKYTNNVLLQPGIDYIDRKNTHFNSVNDRLLFKYPENYFKSADLILSTNGMHNQLPEGRMRKQNWDNVKEYLENERSKNTGEIKNICDQIIMNLNDLHRAQ